jgi:hypothetical protein
MNIFNFEWLLSFNNAKKDSFELFLLFFTFLILNTINKPFLNCNIL